MPFLRPLFSRPFALLSALLLFLPSLAAAAMFNPVARVLDNGLTVVVIENHRAPVVTQLLWYRVGAMDEPPGKSGLAHFVEHLMFKGARSLKSGEFSAIVARNGGNENAFTTADVTGYYISLAADRLELAMRLEADRMAAITPTEAEALKERDVILDERRLRVADSPAALLNERVAAALHPNHPYRKPVIGWEHEVSALTLADALAFHALWYTPDNAFLVVAGDVAPDAVFALAEKYFGSLPRAAARPPRPDWRDPPLIAESQMTLRDPRVEQPVWARHWAAPSYAEATNTDVYALELLADILGASDGRVEQALVTGAKVAVNSGVWYDPDRRGPGEFGFYAIPRDGVAMADVETAALETIAALLRDGVTASELERAKRRLRDSTVLALDSLSGPAFTLGMALAAGRSLDAIESWPERIDSVTLEQVNAAARTLLKSPGFVTSALLSAEPSK